MKKAKLFFGGLLIIGTGLLLMGGLGNSVAEAANQRVTILHTNDIHSHLLGFGPNGEYTPSTIYDDATVGGIARIAAKVNEIRASRDVYEIPTLLLDAGDFMMGTGFEILRGKAELTLMDSLGYDVTTIGNHEYDWMPSGTAEIFSHIPDLSSDLPVVASNIIFDPVHPGDDALKDLFDAGVIQEWYTQTLSNGLKVGFFGLIGEDAVEVAPFAYPLTFEDRFEAAQSMVDALEYEGVDLIVCLSHSGLDEDSALAEAVPGIDVIISGHTHELTEEPLTIGNTLIVQAGCYTQYLGVLDLDLSLGGAHLLNYELIPIDDSIIGDAATQDLVDGFIDELNDILAPLGYSFEEVMAETDFDLIVKSGEEHNLGNLVTDAMRWMVDEYEYDPSYPETKVDFALESNGLIRDDILEGITGNIAFSDAFRVLPLGFGLEGAVGYPMVTIYLTAAEVKKGLEVITTVYPLKGSDYWLSVSGLRFEYNPMLIPFFRVLRIYVGDEETGYSDVPLDTSKNNTELYKVALNYYVAQFIAVIGDYTYGILEIIPKDKDGNSYLDEDVHPDGLDEARVDTDPGTPGIQELQQWKGFMDYLDNFPDTDANGISDVPDRYKGPTGRITEATCFIATAIY
ncbi:MAG: 5'-nucleotidase C-terminal domain-containing protein [Deltaproteobacteria bacterium]|nr:5'-nucleotidase C-terminal domain-containing protein [Deltaproteobacteria bacterium]